MEATMEDAVAQKRLSARQDQLDQKELRLDQEKQRLDQEKQRLDQEKQRLDQEQKEISSMPEGSERLQRLQLLYKNLDLLGKNLDLLASDKAALTSDKAAHAAAVQAFCERQRAPVAAAAAAAVPAATEVFMSRMRQGGIAPSTFGHLWHVWQQSDPPLYACFRPATAQGMACTLLVEALANFLDMTKNEKLVLPQCVKSTYRTLADEMSTSYVNMSTESAFKAAEASYMANAFVGKVMEGEKNRAKMARKTLNGLVREMRLANLLQHDIGELREDKVGEGKEYCTDGSWRVGGILIGVIEVKEDFGSSGSNANMQAMHYYGHSAVEQEHTPYWSESRLPALGFSIIGNYLELTGFAYADTAYAQPLASVTLSDFSMQEPGRTQYNMRVLYAALKTLDAFAACAKKFKDRNEKGNIITRNAELRSPLPYMLCGRFDTWKQLDTSRHVFLCTKDGEQTVIKVLETVYPKALHEKVAGAGLAPKLMLHRMYPGGFEVVETEHLGPPWHRLDRFVRAVPAEQLPSKAAMTRAGEKLLQKLTALGVVHGDLRVNNLFVSVMPASSSSNSNSHGGSSGEVQLRCIDWDWAGAPGAVTYPWNIRTTGEIEWPMPDPSDQPIKLAHDRLMLEQSLKKVCGSLVDTPGAKRPLSDAGGEAGHAKHLRENM